MLNFLDVIFLGLASMVTFTGILIKNFRHYVPIFIIKGFNYGCFAYQGSGANYLQHIEIPKSYYRHFYLFSSVFSSLTLLYMFLVYNLNFGINKYIPIALKAILQQDKPSVPANAAFLALSLLTVQCLRRFYETYYLQVFAKSSKMNLSHYVAGMIHYFAAVVAIIGEAPLFCGDQNRENITWTSSKTSLYSIPCLMTFLWAWYEQFQTNIIFSNLRKDKKSGKVITEDHGIPNGRMFEIVSSPHRLCEVVMYTVLFLLVPTKTFFCIYLWVLSNQIQTAVHAHDWYKKTFKNYPLTRDAIFPRIL